MSEAPQTTAVALPERVPALLRIYNDCLDHLAVILHNTYRRSRRQTPKGCNTLRGCRERIERHVIWDPKGGIGVPLVARAPYIGQSTRVCYTVGAKRDGAGRPIVKDGVTQIWFYEVKGTEISCELELPGSQARPHAPKITRVVPAIMCNGQGDLIRYCEPDGQGILRAVSPPPSIFIKDFDPWTDEEKDIAKGIPLGLGRHENIDLWKTIVRRLAAQGSSRRWEEIDPIPHNLGYPVQFLSGTPVGPVSMQGRIPAWVRYKDQNPEEPHFWLVMALGGKVAQLDDRSQPIVIKGDTVPEQVFHFEETWTTVWLKVWGLPEQLGDLQGLGESLDWGETRFNPLALLGVTLYDVTPRSGPSLVRKALKNPPIDRLVALGMVPPGSSREVAIRTIQGSATLISQRIQETVTEAFDTIRSAVSPGGSESHGMPKLADIFEAQPTSDLLQDRLDNPHEDLLALWLLDRFVVKNLGLTVWANDCYVLVENYRQCLLDLAKAEGVELPLPPEADEPADTSPPEAEEKPTNGASQPPIVWHEGLKRDELYDLAKALDGVTSKTNKDGLIAALTAVCPPTPPS